MSPGRRAGLLVLMLAIVPAAAGAQAASPLMADLLDDVAQVEQKLVALARAMPDAAYGARPAQGVRSVGEVFQHVAADNYLLPIFAGTAAPGATGIVGDDYATVRAYETRAADRATIIADLERSFVHLRTAMVATTTAQLADSVTLFGRRITAQRLWILTTTHLHEHLGQSIAYARANGVVPPWSR